MGGWGFGEGGLAGALRAFGEGRGIGWGMRWIRVRRRFHDMKPSCNRLDFWAHGRRSVVYGLTIIKYRVRRRLPGILGRGQT